LKETLENGRLFIEGFLTWKKCQGHEQTKRMTWKISEWAKVCSKRMKVGKKVWKETWTRKITWWKKFMTGLKLLRHCQEDLVEGITNPKITQEMLEQEKIKKIRRRLDKMTPAVGRLPMRKTTQWKKNTQSPWKTTPPMQMTWKMTKPAKNSPLTTSVARKLGLTVVTNVRMIAERMQHTHLSSAQNEANKLFYKPVLIRSSAVPKPPDSTPVHRVGPTMGGEDGKQTGLRAAAWPIEAQEND
jgi:hypothetical protein